MSSQFRVWDGFGFEPNICQKVQPIKMLQGRASLKQIVVLFSKAGKNKFWFNTIDPKPTFLTCAVNPAWQLRIVLKDGLKDVEAHLFFSTKGTSNTMLAEGNVKKTSGPYIFLFGPDPFVQSQWQGGCSTWISSLRQSSSGQRPLWNWWNADEVELGGLQQLNQLTSLKSKT